MAIFGIKNKTKAVAEKVEKPVVKKVSTKVAKTVKKEKVVTTKDVAPAMSNLVIPQDIILRPRITEKSGIMSEALNLYTFEVTLNSTKHTIARAIKSLYKVTPLKVRTINLPRKKVFIRGKHGVQPAVKKALVYLKKGDKIEFA